MSGSTKLKAERAAIASSCCGFLGEAALTDSAVIILFAGALGAGDMLSMITTAVLPLFNGLLIIPMACFSARVGVRRLAAGACLPAALAYFTAVSAPFWGAFSVAALIGSILLFSLSLTGFVAGWFPLLDSFLTPERRAGFLGRMRFCHQLAAVIFLLSAGVLIGRDPPLWKLQAVLLAGAVIFLGRPLFIAKIPGFPMPESGGRGFAAGLAAAAGNRALAGFSVYQMMLNLAVFGTVPLCALYLKNGLKAPDNVIVFISAAALTGMLAGYLCASKLISFCGMRNSFLLLHALCLPANICLFFIADGSAAVFVIITLLLMLTGFSIAASSVLCSAEMMALSAPDNKVMSMALCGAFYYGSAGLSRVVTSLVLGTGLLAAEWSLGGLRVCRYQTVFLIYAAAAVFAGLFLILIPAFHSEKQRAWRRRSLMIPAARG
jgi:hypothetical protein